MPSKRRSAKRPYSGGHRELNMERLASMPCGERGPGGQEYQVSRISGSAKSYTCPGCHREIPPGTPHVVAWLSEGRFWEETGVGARRHWHSACFDRGLY